MWKHKLFDVFPLLLAIALGIFFFQFIRGSFRLQEKMTHQELQANVIIDEVGETKEENQTLYEKLVQAESEISELRESISLLQQAASPSLKSTWVDFAENEPAKIPRPTLLPELPNTKNFLIVGHHKKLADTVMLALVNEVAAKITLASIPRDLVVNGRKINEYLSLFSAEKLKEKAEVVIGLPIHGYVILDFRAFEIIVDLLGGVDIHVPTALYDSLYPDGQGGYTLYSITAGSHHMSGAEALQYARSRHSTSDFDRVKRQQQILKALQERFINFEFLKKIDEVKGIFEALADGIETDLGFFEMVDVMTKYEHFVMEAGYVISTENFLSSGTNIAGQYILMPKGGNFGKIQKWIRDILGG